MDLENWFLENKRDFPWRQETTPYRVWISEVMLQQTRASVVIPYFLRWMELFPDVKALYTASLDQVIKAWEGLGYYSRARNLHSGAKEIVERFGGVIPDTKEELLSIRGFGPYTVGALLSFAFHQKAPAVDGNVLRVISRLFCIEAEITKLQTRKIIEKKVEALLDLEKPWVTAEAFIELGATICTKKPQCALCPLQKQCLGFKNGKEADLPVKNLTQKTTPLFRSVLVIESEGKVLVGKGAKGKVMADLYEFPYVEGRYSISEMKEKVEKLCQSKGVFLERMSPCSHTFTRYKAHLFPYRFRINDFQVIEGREWIEISQLGEFPFSSGHRKILEKLKKSI